MYNINKNTEGVMETQLKEFVIGKKGRKYFECLLSGRYKAKLIINDVSRGFVEGAKVFLEVIDCSEQSKYGGTLKFEPVSILEGEALQAFEQEKAKRAQAREAEKWLNYAESDVADGRYSSNAIQNALSMCAGHESLQARLDAVRQKIEKNKRKAVLDKAKLWLGYAEEDAKKGLADSNAIQNALSMCAAHESLQARLDAFKQKIAENRKGGRVLETMRIDAPKTEWNMAFPLETAPPLNHPFRIGGRVLVLTAKTKRFTIDEDSASVYGSAFLGREGEQASGFRCRNASEEEVAQLEREEAEQEAARQARSQRQQAIKMLVERIKSEGEKPEGKHSPSGTVYLDTQTLYGGGDWFVVSSDFIWYVRNNGADGDSWGANNILTGGGGGIGWRIPFDTQIAEQIAALDKAAA
jgi:hypothetical protein